MLSDFFELIGIISSYTLIISSGIPESILGKFSFYHLDQFY